MQTFNAEDLYDKFTSKTYLKSVKHFKIQDFKDQETKYVRVPYADVANNWIAFHSNIHSWYRILNHLPIKIIYLVFMHTKAGRFFWHHSFFYFVSWTQLLLANIISQVTFTSIHVADFKFIILKIIIIIFWGPITSWS